MEALSESKVGGLYDKDSWTWARQQAEALRQGDFAAVDWENVIEEIEDLGLSEERAWTSSCKNVLSHMLKIEYSGAREACWHWVKEIRTWRREMYAKHLDNPGMRSKFQKLLAKAWHLGREAVLDDLPSEGNPPYRVEKHRRRVLAARIPEECPYDLVDVIGYDPHQKRAKLRKNVPKAGVWPPDVARTLNEELDTGYPVGPGSREPDRGWSS